MIYSAYKLNKQVTIYSLDIFLSQFGTSLLFHVWFCCFLTCTQVSQEAGQVVWCSYLFKNFPQFVVIHTIKGFSVVNEAEVGAFLEFSCFFYDSVDVGNLTCGFSAFSKSSLNIWNFLVHILLKACLENFERYFASMWGECKFGKLSSGHRTGNSQFSFQSQRKARPKKVQTTTQLYSFHTLIK